ncbi:L-threonylcarbamoyladenylate synthase [Enterocloster bolteae]|uniref:L-threonylcarbamoyladenylate synthase n=1 Tax=Enterocloster bolteae TaxID=208479 RepID=UPI00041F1944|nr:L-threonylcarbamoyladenylate synthase [Enterocloster bolteae]UOX69862.1 L-threonylcarbamoyladenylate synthase [Enterocloster bolteae]
METKRIIIEDRNHIKDEELKEAAGILRSGGLVAFPTETVYGLGGNALDEDAARKIYAAKGRPSDNPLIAHVSCVEEVEPLVKEIPEAGRKLMEAFWPGPLTMIFPKSEKVPYGTTGGLDTVAIRMPDDLVANRLIALAGVPVAAPSANTSGRPSPTTADHVWQDMNGRIDMIIDGGPVGIGVESTIVDVSSAVPAVLRPGAITMEMLEEVLGEVSVDPAILGPLSADVRPKAPGMKYKHYAPKADLTLVEPGTGADRESGAEQVTGAEQKTGAGQVTGAEQKTRAGQKTGADRNTGAYPETGLDETQLQAMIRKVRELSREKIEAGYKVGVICTDESRDCYTDGEVRSIGARKSQASVAHNLYALLREFDDLGVDYIFSESFPKDHLGQAIMNRLSKAAGYKIVKV